MELNSTTLQGLFEQPAGDLEDLLMYFVDRSIAYGMGLPSEGHPSPAVNALFDRLLARWHAELRASRAERELYDPKMAIDDVPGWLLGLPNQAKIEEGLANGKG